MSGSFQFFDETSGVQLTQGDNANNVDIGNAAPVGPLSMDGTTFRKGSAAILGDALAPSSSTIKTQGSISLGANVQNPSPPSSAQINHTLGRIAFILVSTGGVVNNPCAITGQTTTEFSIQNWDGVAHTAVYVYI